MDNNRDQDMSRAEKLFFKIGPLLHGETCDDVNQCLAGLIYHEISCLVEVGGKDPRDAFASVMASITAMILDAMDLRNATVTMEARPMENVLEDILSEAELAMRGGGNGEEALDDDE